MTNEEMAAELTKAGWRVQPPLTQANCPHTNMRGTMSTGIDGSGSSDMYCDCGYRSKRSWGPRADFKWTDVIPRNAGLGD